MKRQIIHGLALYAALGYLALHFALLVGYERGRIPHTPFTPTEAIELMLLFSVVLSVTCPMIWLLALRRRVDGLIVVFVSGIFIATAMLDLAYYYLAAVAG